MINEKQYTIGTRIMLVETESSDRECCTFPMHSTQFFILSIPLLLPFFLFPSIFIYIYVDIIKISTTLNNYNYVLMLVTNKFIVYDLRAHAKPFFYSLRRDSVCLSHTMPFVCFSIVIFVSACCLFQIFSRRIYFYFSFISIPFACCVYFFVDLIMA